MTTVVDPNGTPVPVFNRSGTTIVEVEAALDPDPATPIPHASGHTIALITGHPEDDAIELPDNAEVGDLVECYVVPVGYAVAVKAPTGENISGASSYSIGGDDGIQFRKINATTWRRNSGS